MQTPLPTETKPSGSKFRFLLEQSRSPSVQTIERMIAHIAPTNIPVLIVGESGTGKEVVAHHIHELSLRQDKPLVKTICASLKDETLAIHFRKDHHNEETSGEEEAGTVFLKEISELDYASQRNLLYSLPREGCAATENFSAPRLISSTTRHLEQEVTAGRFRADLYYQISVVSVPLPPLRQRREDIPAFLELFLTKYSTLLGRPRPHLDAQDLALIEGFCWPGNIRELENVVMKIVVLNDPKVVLSQLDLKIPAPPSGVSAGTLPLKTAARAASHRTERQLILETLAKTRWNRKRAAQQLQISYKALLYKLKQIRAEEQEAV